MSSNGRGVIELQSNGTHGPCNGFGGLPSCAEKALSFRARQPQTNDMSSCRQWQIMRQDHVLWLVLPSQAYFTADMRAACRASLPDSTGSTLSMQPCMQAVCWS